MKQELNNLVQVPLVESVDGILLVCLEPGAVSRYLNAWLWPLAFSTESMNVRLQVAVQGDSMQHIADV